MYIGVPQGPTLDPLFLVLLEAVVKGSFTNIPIIPNFFIVSAPVPSKMLSAKFMTKTQCIAVQLTILIVVRGTEPR